MLLRTFSTTATINNIYSALKPYSIFPTLSAADLETRNYEKGKQVRICIVINLRKNIQISSEGRKCQAGGLVGIYGHFGTGSKRQIRAKIPTGKTRRIFESVRFLNKNAFRKNIFTILTLLKSGCLARTSVGNGRLHLRQNEWGIILKYPKVRDSRAWVSVLKTTVFG